MRAGGSGGGVTIYIYMYNIYIICIIYIYSMLHLGYRLNIVCGIVFQNLHQQNIHPAHFKTS